ncbi:NAD(P)H-binding protein [Pseudomonas sp. RIT-To-2]|uniref:NAD(P)H-binding protein n=1 Tax=Pseudomonas sp. RIT-To-2 TaxID=3462541 RepID=UPI0024137EAA
MKVLILGAAGQIARHVVDLLSTMPAVEQTLYLRNSNHIRLSRTAASARIVEGDVMDSNRLEAAMVGQDVVYANLSGELGEQSQAIIEAMRKTKVSRLIFVSSMGIYDEVPGERYGKILDPYRESARHVESSGLSYTIVRPAWLNDDQEVSYGTTTKGENFKNSSDSVSRRSVADLIVKLITDPGVGIRESLGVHKK